MPISIQEVIKRVHEQLEVPPMSCCGHLDWTNVDQTREHHPDCTGMSRLISGVITSTVPLLNEGYEYAVTAVRAIPCNASSLRRTITELIDSYESRIAELEALAEIIPDDLSDDAYASLRRMLEDE